MADVPASAGAGAPRAAAPLPLSTPCPSGTAVARPWARDVVVRTTTVLTTTGGTVWGAARRAVDYFEAAAPAIGLDRPGIKVRPPRACAWGKRVRMKEGVCMGAACAMACAWGPHAHGGCMRMGGINTFAVADTFAVATPCPRSQPAAARALCSTLFLCCPRSRGRRASPDPCPAPSNPCTPPPYPAAPAGPASLPAALPRQVVELGAGCGMLGLTLARNLPRAAEVCLTEQVAGGALDHLRANVAANAAVGTPGAAAATTAACDWLRLQAPRGRRGSTDEAGSAGGSSGGGGGSDFGCAAGSLGQLCGSGRQRLTPGKPECSVCSSTAPHGCMGSQAAGGDEAAPAAAEGSGAAGGGAAAGGEEDDMVRLLSTRWDYVIGSDLVGGARNQGPERGAGKGAGSERGRRLGSSLRASQPAVWPAAQMLGGQGAPNPPIPAAIDHSSCSPPPWRCLAAGVQRGGHTHAAACDARAGACRAA